MESKMQISQSAKFKSHQISNHEISITKTTALFLFEFFFSKKTPLCFFAEFFPRSLFKNRCVIHFFSLGILPGVLPRFGFLGLCGVSKYLGEGGDECFFLKWGFGSGTFLHRYLNVPNRVATVISTHGSKGNVTSTPSGSIF